MKHHEILPDGESTARWAIREAGFLGSIKQLVNCARCGNELPPKPPTKSRRYRDVLKPTMHIICDDCYGELPE